MEERLIVRANQYKSIVVLTGAGVSRASGLPTFRGVGGVWNNPNTAKLSSPENLATEPESYWQLWGQLKDEGTKASPNAGHYALAAWEKKINADQKFLLVTQNVDNLHQRAGSQNIAELHGSLYRTRCTNPQCSLKPFSDDQSHTESTPRCQLCDSPLRPDLVLFHEMLPVDAEYLTKRVLRDCDLFIAIGTSCSVSPASRFVEWAKYAGAKTILINQDITEAPKSFNVIVEGLSEEVLPDALQ